MRHTVELDPYPYDDQADHDSDAVAVLLERLDAYERELGLVAPGELLTELELILETKGKR